MSEDFLAISNESFVNAIYHYEVRPPDSTITEEELRILGLNPAEVFSTVPIYPTDPNNEVVNHDDFYLDDSDLDEIVERNIHFGNNGDIFPMIVQYSHDRGDFSDNYLTSDDDDDDNTEEEIGEFEDEDEDSSSSDDEDFDEHQVSISSDSTSEERERTPLPLMDSDQSVNNSWDLNDDYSVGSLPHTISIESLPFDNTSYSEDTTSSSGSNINYSNDSNSSGSTSSSSSSSSSN